jgi:16S rRNA processing protein RimM
LNGIPERLSDEQNDERIVVGRIAAAYGVRGWFHVQSFTIPQENILAYSPWYVLRGGNWQCREPAEGRRHGKGIVARFDECRDRDCATAWRDSDIAIGRGQLPETAPGEYYWQDLIGMAVVNLEGAEFGKVVSLMQTGANDVLVVVGERERLIPFLRGQVVIDVDLSSRLIKVDWDPEF